MKRTKKAVYIVEIYEKGRWEPTVGASLTLADARREVRYDWRYNYPRTKFRLARYTPGRVVR